ncbi:MAG: hypothetical protein F7C81_05715 [Desulfurococcales archaeon]|nr:hypothetical protein [Desulfurococcales archaeon]
MKYVIDSNTAKSVLFLKLSIPFLGIMEADVVYMPKFYILLNCEYPLYSGVASTLPRSMGLVAEKL